jgi:type IV secretion system protein VirD4
MISKYIDDIAFEDVAITLGGGFLFALLILVINILKNSSIGNKKLHGTARWANHKDIKATGLIANDGIYVGGWKDKKGRTHYLRHNGFEHVLTYAPTGSGKGVSLGVPTLLSWPHSVFINDMKGELYALTAGWRKKFAGNKIIRFEPASTESAAWNPLNEIRIDEGKEVGDVQNLVSIIVDPDGKGKLDHWEETSQALLVGVILHVIYKSIIEGTPRTLPYVDKLLSPADVSVNSLWVEMTQYPHVNGTTHQAVASAARNMLDRPEDEAGSVLSTANRFLALYRDPVVANNLSDSDFYIKDLMNYDAPVSLYITTNPGDKARLRPLVRIMIASIIRILCDEVEYENVPNKRGAFDRFFNLPVTYTVRQKKNYKHRLLGFLDELPSLGKLSILEESLAYSRGYGISFYLFCQDIRQLRKKEFGYGQDETITSNCHIQNAFPPNNLETAKHLSDMTGETTIINEEITTSGKRAGMIHGNVSRRLHEVKRPLLTPDEILRLPGATKNKNGLITKPGDMLISVAGKPMIYGIQTLYFQDEIFLARASIPAPKYSDKIRHGNKLEESEFVQYV